MENKEFKKGDLISDLYRVESDPIRKGGMGLVYKVSHTTWNVMLAMKQPKAEYFQTEKDKNVFIRECKRWFELGLHQHIVSGYYVREIEGIPSIFIEWMEGGSLKEYIDEETGGLYKDSEGKNAEKEIVQERILDIAIQAARGLSYANEKGLIHRDVKPDNLMLTTDGTVKVTDFGITAARESLGDNVVNVNLSSGATVTGYSLQYCSPEQRKKSGKEPTCAIDIFSWAVSVLEMFLGYLPWYSGEIAGRYCDFYFGRTRIPVPDSMKDLLRHCLQLNAEDRPKDFGEVEKSLLAIYKEVTGNDYWRPVAKAAADTADSLNNYALSYLDLGEPEKAEKCWEDAIKLNPNSSISLYNQGLHLWRTAKINDEDVVHRLTTSVLMKDINYYYYLAKLHIARGDAEKAIESISEATTAWGEMEELKQLQIESERRIESGLDGKLLHTLIGHNQFVESVCFSPHGRLALSGSRDKTLKIWDIVTDECINTLEGHTNNVECVCFSSDGKLALSGSWDKTVKVWDIVTGKCIQTLAGHTSSVNSVSFSVDGKQAFSISSDESIKTWDIETGNCIQSTKIDGLRGAFNAGCFSSDRRFALSGSSHLLKVWDVKTGKCKRLMDEYTSSVHSVCFSSDGRFALSGGWDSRVYLLDIEAGECIRIFKGHTKWINSVCFSPNGKLALSGSSDNSIIVWEIETGRRIRKFEHENSVLSVCFSPDSRLAISGDGTNVKIWNIPVLSTYEPIISHIRSMKSAIEESKQIHSAIEEIDRLISQKDISPALDKLNEIRKISSFASSSEAFFETSRKLAAYCISRQLLGYTLQTHLKSSGEDERDLNFAKENNRMLFSRGNSIVLLNIETHEYRYLNGHTNKVTSVCFSPNGKLVLSGSQDNTVKVWDIATGKCIHTLEDQSNDGILSVNFSPDGKYVICGSEDKTAKIGMATADGYFCTLKGHTNVVNCVCFSPDGRLILTGSVDKTIRVWDVATKKCTHVLTGFETYVRDLRFSPAGRKIFAISKNEIYVYSLDYDLYFPGWKDWKDWREWEEGAQPYFDIFLTLHSDWTEEDLNNILIPDLQTRGYGWISQEGIKTKLIKMTNNQNK